MSAISLDDPDRADALGRELSPPHAVGEGPHPTLPEPGEPGAVAPLQVRPERDRIGQEQLLLARVLFVDATIGDMRCTHTHPVPVVEPVGDIQRRAN